MNCTSGPPKRASGRRSSFRRANACATGSEASWRSRSETARSWTMAAEAISVTARRASSAVVCRDRVTARIDSRVVAWASVSSAIASARSLDAARESRR